MSARKKIYVGLAVALVGLALWLRGCRRWGPDLRLGSGPSAALRKNDREVVSYDSNSHTLTVTTSSSTVRSYTRDPIIRIQKDGKVLVQKKLFGLEHRPFMGLGYSARPTAYLGLDLVDAWRFDAGPAVAISNLGLRPLLQGSMNVWSNTSLMLGYGVQQDFHAAVVLHF